MDLTGGMMSIGGSVLTAHSFQFFVAASGCTVFGLIDSLQLLGSNFSYGVRMGDVDGDGDPDVLIANSSSANVLHTNDGSGLFVDSM